MLMSRCQGIHDNIQTSLKRRKSEKVLIWREGIEGSAAAFSLVHLFVMFLVSESCPGRTFGLERLQSCDMTIRLSYLLRSFVSINNVS